MNVVHGVLNAEALGQAMHFAEIGGRRIHLKLDCKFSLFPSHGCSFKLGFSTFFNLVIVIV